MAAPATLVTATPPNTCDPLVLAQWTLCQLQQQFALMSVNPKPTYSVGGRSFSWESYLRMLMDAIKQQAELVNMLDPFEFHVRAYPGC
jgi:hypothetical protein